MKFYQRKPAFVYMGLLIVIILLFAVNVATGPVNIPWQALPKLLISPQANSEAAEIVWQLRLPHALMVLLVGMGLGLAGCVLQLLLRNPLSDPGILGMNSGAGLVVVLVLLLAPVMMPWLPVFAFVGALVIALILYVVAHLAPTGRIGMVLLAGIAINALLSAVMSAILYFASNNTLNMMMYWGFGAVSDLSWGMLLISAVVMLVGCAMLLAQTYHLAVWSLGEAEAHSLGLPVSRFVAMVITGVALVVGAAVAIAGPIAFIGLIVPHISQLCFKLSFRHKLIGSMLVGASLLLLADYFCHIIISPSILPLGIAAALFGAPMFLWLLLRFRERL